MSLIDIPLGTTVLAINGNDITMSSISNITVSGSNDLDVNFVSPELEDSTTWSSYKSETPSEISGHIFLRSVPKIFEAKFCFLAAIQFIFPLKVLISPLWQR